MTTATSNESAMMVRLSSLNRLLELAGEVIIVSSYIEALSKKLIAESHVDEDICGETSELATTSSRISADLHDLVTQVRTVRMETLSGRFKRLARDTSRRLGKTIRFEIVGEQIAIDKTLAERIYDPIAHQIRNAIYHGIEERALRCQRGKDEVGSVVMSIRNLETKTHIEISDDGGGVDLERVRERLLQMDSVPDDAVGKMSTERLYDCLFLPGFSTAERTSDTAGRGVGMDVIKRAMDEVGGDVALRSQPGRGTTLTLIVPRLTAVNITDSMVVRAGDTYFAFPIGNVVSNLSIDRSRVEDIANSQLVIEYLGDFVPVFDVLELYSEPRLNEAGDQLRLVVLELKKQRIAVMVSEFLSPQKLVINKFEALQVPGLLGTAVLSGRQLAMIVDLPALMLRAIGKGREQASWSAAGVVSCHSSDAIPIDAAAAAIDASTSASYDAASIEFLQEIAQGVVLLNDHLLELERERTRENCDSVFRLAHSIKGNLIMFGAEALAETMHSLESVLDLARQGGLALEAEVFDVLFDGCSHVERSIGESIRGAVAPPLSSELLERMSALTATSIEQPQPGRDEVTETIELDATGELQLSARRRAGMPMYRCRIAFTAGDQPRFLVGYLILNRIQSVADVIGCTPTIQTLEHGLCSGDLYVLISPRTTEHDLVERLGDNLKQHFGVTHFEASAFA